MKHYITRIFTSLLSLCLALSFSIPTVLATDAATDTAAPTTEYHFNTYADNGTHLAKITKDIRISYGAKTINWRFETASNGYQFRVQDLHPDAPGTGKNMIIANSMQFFGADGWWYALRLQAPGTGKYALTLNKGGRAQTEVYFLSATAVENALGENAVAYSETICEDPYRAEGTEAFSKYKEVINTMLAETTPVMAAVSVEENVMTGECSFSSQDEYIMVIKYVSEGSLTAQISSLSATWIGEAENIPGADLLNADNGSEFDFQTVLIPVIVIAVVGIVVIVAVTSRKKSTKKTEE